VLRCPSMSGHRCPPVPLARAIAAPALPAIAIALAPAFTRRYLLAMEEPRQRIPQAWRTRARGKPRRPGAVTRRTPVQVAGLRYYSPGLGRWTARDPIGERGGISSYSFVSNGTPAGVDLFGLAERKGEGCWCCCAEDVLLAVRPLPSPSYGHRLSVDLRFSWLRWNKQYRGDCKYEWWEMINDPGAAPGGSPLRDRPGNTWVNLFEHRGYAPGPEGNWDRWRRTMAQMGPSFMDWDEPKLDTFFGQPLGDGWKLEFKIKALSAPGCSCEKAYRQVHAVQELWPQAHPQVRRFTVLSWE
jgi:RHS repeat-associated protein